MSLNLKFKIIEHGAIKEKNTFSLWERIIRTVFGLIFPEPKLLPEKYYIQIIGINGTKVVAGVVLVPKEQHCKLQNVVVDGDTGSKMLAFCEDFAKKRYFKSIYCHARESEVNFYLNNGYVAEGEYFDEDTIQYLNMRKVL